jgi:hypothetical protein
MDKIVQETVTVRPRISMLAVARCGKVKTEWIFFLEHSQEARVSLQSNAILGPDINMPLSNIDKRSIKVTKFFRGITPLWSDLAIIPDEGEDICVTPVE